MGEVKGEAHGEICKESVHCQLKSDLRMSRVSLVPSLSKMKEQFMLESEKALMHETGRSGLVHWDDPEGQDGEGGGRGVQDGEHM